MARKTSYFLGIALALGLNVAVVAATSAYTERLIDGNATVTGATGSDSVLGSIQDNSKLGGYDDVAASGPMDTAALIINFLLTLLGAIAVALTVYAGFLWLIARGNEEQIKKAKDLLAGSAIGLMLILASYSITAYVFRSFVNITN